MKIESKKEKPFEPITITLETEKEAALMRLLFGRAGTVADCLKSEGCDGFSYSKIVEVMNESPIWEFLDDRGIKDAIARKHFGGDC